MENNFLLTDNMLWDYADGFLSPEEKKQVDAYLHLHPEWKAHLDAILKDKKAFADLSPDRPDAGFSDRVMAAWTVEHVRSKATKPGTDWIVRTIAIVFGFFVLVPVFMIIFSAVQISPSELIPFEMPALPQVNWAGIMGHPAMHYTVYLGLTFLFLRLLEKYLRGAFDRQRN